MADTTGTSWQQVKGADRHGTEPYGQASDGTGTDGNLAMYNVDGSVTDSGVVAPPAGTILVGSGGSGSGVDSVFPYGAWYGQVPRGGKTGSNTVFALDYTLASPYTILAVNGVSQLPSVDGPFTLAGDYSITDSTLTYTESPPKETDWHYIWYFAGDQAPHISSTEGSVTLYLTSAHFPSSSGSGPNFGAGASTSAVATIAPVPNWFHDTAGFAQRTDSHALTGADLDGWVAGSTFLLLMLENDGGSVGAFSPADEFWIYDCYVQVVLSDSSTQTWRPTTYTELVGSGTSGSITNPENIFDADATTYAVISALAYGGAGLNGVFLNVTNFVRTA